MIAKRKASGGGLISAPFKKEFPPIIRAADSSRPWPPAGKNRIGRRREDVRGTFDCAACALDPVRAAFHNPVPNFRFRKDGGA